MDLAKIGFRADTTELEKATGSLNRLKGAASGVTPSVMNIAKVMQSASSAFLGAAAGMTQAIASLVAATKGASTANIKAANDAAKFTKSLYDAASAQDRLANSIVKTNMVIKKQATDMTMFNRVNMITGVTRSSGKSAAESADVFNAAASAAPTTRDQMPNRFNTGNIAAQFQDIGVVAAMGMSPLTVALQQGTQISAILNSMEKPLQGIAYAFTQIINPVSLLAIALTALAVVGLQTVNWTQLAQSFLTMMANGLTMVTPYVEDLTIALSAFGVVLAVAFAPQALAWLGAFTLSVVKLGVEAVITGTRMVAAWMASLSPLGMIVVGLGLVLAAVVTFKKAFSNLLGTDVMMAIKSGLNQIIGWFLGTLGGIVAMVVEAWKKIKGESTQSLAQAFSGTLNTALKVDYVGAVTSTVSAGIKIAEEKIRSFAQGLSAMDAVDEDKKANVSDKVAKALAGSDEELKQYTEGVKFAKETTRGFVGDMKNSLMEGKSAWEAFGDAISNVLDKILDKILDVGVELLFSGLSETSGGKSIFGAIGSFISGSFGASGTSAPAPSPAMAAKGATFTNGIYTQPTPFAFAQGGSFGVMGEAGPEAVMPLERGSDGSLGVRLNDSGGSTKPTVNVEVIVNGNASVEQETNTMPDGSELRKFIINTVSQANASGQFDASNTGRYGITPRRTAR